MSSYVRYPGINLGSGHPDMADRGEELIFGFYMFMMSDAILFGLLFAIYATMRYSQAGGPGPHTLYDLRSAFIETMALLASSFTYGMASIALKYKHSIRSLILWLCVTMALGLLFLGFEVHDFVSMFSKGGGPTRDAFSSAFFALVPLHGLHVTVGIIWMMVMIGQLRFYGIDTQTKFGLLRLGLFWHFLDIVWVGIFTVVYLAGLS